MRASPREAIGGMGRVLSHHCRWWVVVLAVASRTSQLTGVPGEDPGGPVFEEVAAAAGLDFRHFAGLSGKLYLPEIMGPGVGLLDYDMDGDLDVYILQGGVLEPGASAPEDRSANRLFTNELMQNGAAGPLKFQDVTSEAGVGHDGYGMGIAVGDYDGDADPDIYLTNFGPNVLFRNNGDGTFSDVTRASGTEEARWSTGAAFLDYDRDDDLDLFVLNYIDFTVAGNKTCYDSIGGPDYCNPNLYRPLPDRLFRNDGGGKFSDVTVSSGVGQLLGPGLGVVADDFNSDGWVDVYVANDGAANHLWLNQGDGTFIEDALMAGSAYNVNGAPEGSMGLAAGDFDGDGDPDLFMTHLTGETNTLYVNDGRGNFHDETGSRGLGATSLAPTGFGTEWFDYDNDGDLDVVVTNVNGPVRLLRNRIGSRNHWLSIELRASGANRFGLGARIAVRRAGRPELWRRHDSAGSYLSSSEMRSQFGLGESVGPVSILVLWPSGTREIWDGVQVNSRVVLERGSGREDSGEVQQESD